MSAVVVVAVPLMMAYPVLLSAAVAVASASGFTFVERTARSMAAMVETEETCDEIEMEAGEEFAKVLKSEGGFTLQKEDLKVIFAGSREGGKVRMMVTGAKERSKEDLKALGQEVMNNILQKYAYDRLMGELKKEGFSMVAEQVEEDRTIRLKVRKW
jgi:hypothetical protein